MSVNYIICIYITVLDASHTKFEMIEEVVVPEAAWKALDFLPYKGQRTKPPYSTFFFPYASERRIMAGEFISLKSKHQRRSPDFKSISSTPTYVTFSFCISHQL